MFILHYGLASDLDKINDHIFLPPLGRGAWRLAWVRVYFQYHGFT